MLVAFTTNHIQSRVEHDLGIHDRECQLYGTLVTTLSYQMHWTLTKRGGVVMCSFASRLGRV